MTRVALVTGAAGGIGRAIVARLLESGCRVYAADLRGSLPSGSETGDGPTWLELDVTDRADAEVALARIEAEAGRLDVLVNCAGIVRRSGTTEVDDGAAASLWSVNVAGAARLSALARTLLRPGGCIVNIGSVTAAIGRHPEIALYGSSKAALEAFTRYLACDLGGEGIRAVGVAPGFIDVPMSADWEQASGGKAALEREVPLGRLGTIEEIAEVVEFVASERASYLTGNTIYVDGGVASR